MMSEVHGFVFSILSAQLLAQHSQCGMHDAKWLSPSHHPHVGSYCTLSS